MPESVERVTKVMTNSSLYWARPLQFEIVGWRAARCVLRNVPEFNVLPGIRELQHSRLRASISGLFAMQ